MRIQEFFKEPIFQFPLKASEYFPSHLSNILSDYVDKLKQIDDENKDFVSKHIDQVTNSCELINTITQYYFEGKILKAHEVFSKLVTHLEQYLLQKDRNAVIGGIDDRLFKARPKLEKGFDLEDMFHVPFELRYNTKSNRFSLSGLPCLYLANSVYTCWEELDRPFFSQMAFSRFETFWKNFKYLDLSVNLWYFENSFDEERGKRLSTMGINDNLQKATYLALEKFLQVFPLYAACYIKVYNKLADFKPEYIFPQMLMEWIADTDWVDGIIYESTKTERLKISGGLPNLKDSLNYAYPVRSYSEKGFCNTLTKHFKLTKPTSWEMVQILHPDVARKQIDLKQDVIGKVYAPAFIHFNLPSEKPIMYHETEFGRFEHYLMLQTANQLPNRL